MIFFSYRPPVFPKFPILDIGEWFMGELTHPEIQQLEKDPAASQEHIQQDEWLIQQQEVNSAALEESVRDVKIWK